MWGLVQDDSTSLQCKFIDVSGALLTTAGNEAVEDKAVGRQSADDECHDECGRTWDGTHVV